MHSYSFKYKNKYVLRKYRGKKNTEYNQCLYHLPFYLYECKKNQHIVYTKNIKTCHRFDYIHIRHYNNGNV